MVNHKQGSILSFKHFGQAYTSNCIQGCGKGTDGGAVERRLKKSNDFTLGQVFGDFFVGIKLIH